MLELVAEGRSNKGIGERLVITERAVQKHVTSIFHKLGLQRATTTTAGSSPCSHTSAPSRKPLGGCGWTHPSRRDLDALPDPS